MKHQQEATGPDIAQDAQPDLRDQAPSRYAWYVTIILMLVYAFSYIDRQLPYILLESIKHDLHLSDTQVGLFTGVAFALTYATLGIPLAALADRSSRKKVIIGCLAAWSAITTLGGMAQNFWQLAATRIGVAAGEAGCTPAAHSMIAGYVSPRFRGKMIGFYTCGAQLGVVIALSLGGWINHVFNWRLAMYLLGAPGLVLVVLMIFTIKEPGRVNTSEIPDMGKVGIGHTLKTILKQKVIVHILLAGALSSFSSAAGQVFTPSYIIRTFHMNTAQIGFTYGLIMGLCGIVGSYVGGAVGDRLRIRNRRYGLMWAALAMAVTAPATALALLSPSYWTFIAFLTVAQLGYHVYSGPALSILQSRVPPRMHAVTSAVYLFAVSGFGGALGPLFVGMVSDALHVKGSADALRVALLLALIPRAWSAVHFVLAARALPLSEPKVVPAAT